MNTNLYRSSSPQARRMRLAVATLASLFLFIAGIGLFALQSIPQSFASAPEAGDVEITKLASVTEVDAGVEFTYRLLYRCADLTNDCTNVEITDVLPPELDHTTAVLIGSVHTVAETRTGDTVTFDFGPTLAAGATGEVKIRIRFPGDATDGDIATNSATITSDGGSDTSLDVDVTVRNPVGTATPTPSPTPSPTPNIDDIEAGKEWGNGSEFAIGNEVSYAIFATNHGDNSVDNFYFEDMLPAGIRFTGFESGQWSDNVPVSIFYQTNLNTTWTAWPAAFTYNSDDAHTVSALSLGGGEYVTGLRWSFGTVPAGFSHDGNRPRINGTVLNTNSVGDTISNCNNAFADGSGGALSDTTCYDITVVDPAGQPDVEKLISSSGPYIAGSVITYSVRVHNWAYATDVLTNPVAMDLLPAGVTFTGDWSYTQISGGPAPAPVFEQIADYDSTGRTLLRWSWTGASAHAFEKSERVDIQFGVTVDSGTTGSIDNRYYVTSNDAPVDECQNEDGTEADVNDLDGDGDRSETLCYDDVSTSVSVVQPKPNVVKTRSTTGIFLPGDVAVYQIRAENSTDAAGDWVNPILMDLLPVGLSYTGVFTMSDFDSLGAPTPTLEEIPNYNGSGRTLLRWSWTGANAWTLAAGDKLFIDYNLQIDQGAGGTIENIYYVTSHETPSLDCVGNDATAEDIYDLDDDGGIGESFCHENATIEVEDVAALESEKLVQGQLDTDYSKYPDTGLTVPGGTANYKLTVNNPGNITMTNIVVYDILPFIGDTGVIVTDTRDTEWRPNLVGAVNAPAGVTVYYSEETNPCRPEVVASAGCVDDWTTVLPADPSTVQAIKFDFGAIQLAPLDELELTWPMRAPVDAPTDGEIAWNSFAYAAERADNGDALLPSEPIKVGIEIQPITPAAYGNYVWVDTNQNGIQDEGGTTGVDGIRVELYRDNGDGVSDPTNDTLESFTLTSGGGAYVFPDLPAGDYYAVFYLPPTYTSSPADQGGDDTADSDGIIGTYNGFDVVIAPVTTLVEGEFDYTWDQGIYQPPPPPAAVGNYVWFDENNNGTQDESAANGINGVTVNLYSSADPSTPISTTVTSNDVNGNPGYYLFDKLPAGDYFLEFELPTGATHTTQGATGSSDPADSDQDATTGRTETFTLVNGQYDDTWDAGIIMPTGNLSLGDRVWIESDNDGMYEPFLGEMGVNGVVVNLYVDTDDSGDYTPGVDEFFKTTTTFTKSGVPGFYEFTDLPAEDYIVQIDPVNFNGGNPLNGTSSTTGNGAAPDPDDNANNDDNGDPLAGHGVVSTAITLSDGAEPDDDGDTDTDSNLTVDFGFWDGTLPSGTAAIGNYIWVDENGDGYQDAGERGIPGVIVTMVDGSGNVYTTTTDANGGYLFPDLVAGTYTVTVDTSQPALDGMIHTGVTLPGADFGNQDPTGYAVTVGEGEENLTADFGFNWSDPTSNDGLGALGDRVWYDLDGDGVQDPDELGIEGVELELFDKDGNSLGTTTTDATGYYIFDDLPTGIYTVVVNPATLPAGYDQTGDPDHYGMPGTDNDNRTTTPVLLEPGDVFLLVDFGYQPGGSADPLNTIGDTIWFDADADGVEDAGEPGIPGVTVSLYDSNGNVVATTTTDENGEYLFTGIPDGTYTVQVTDTNNVLGELDPSGDPDGTLDNMSTVTVSGGQTNLDQDFGYTPEGHDPSEGLIGDTIWLDVDGDGTQNGEPGLEGVIITLTYPDGSVVTTTTDENGNYSFGGLDPTQTYTVTVSPQNFTPGGVLEGLDPTADPDGGTPNQSTVDLLADGPINLLQDFGYQPPAGQAARIGNLVWLDTDADGVLDAGESPIGNVTIDLYRDLDGDGMLDPGEPLFASTVTTDTINAGTYGADGTYIFEGLPAGDYIVDVTDRNGVLAGYWKSAGTPATDNNSQTDPYALSVAANSENLTADFGYYVELAAIGNYVWYDANSDGQQDGGEEGINGVAVTLTVTYPNGDVAILSTTTMTDPTGTSAGYYSFDGLLADENYRGIGGANEPTFTITVGTVPGLAPTVEDSGSDLTDSDPHSGTSAQPVQGSRDTTLGNTTDTIASYDFGFTRPGAIGDYVWYDADNDGKQDPDEEGIANVLIGLYDGDGNLIATEYTNASGGYLFDGLGPGDYTVAVLDGNTGAGGLDVLNGLNTTSGPQVYTGTTITLAPGEVFVDADFGYVRDPGVNALIGDTVWYDADGDGVQGPSEVGIPGVVIVVTDGTNTYTATTNSLGNYFVDVPPGTYTVTVDTSTLPAGLTQTYDWDENLDNSTVVTVGAGEQFLDADFGYNEPTLLGRIGNQVWQDDDIDGVFDPGEPGVAGVTVELIHDVNGDGIWQPGEPIIANATTDENGEYYFDGLPADDYLVFVSDNNRVMLGWSPTIPGPNAGDHTTDNNNQGMPYAITLPAGGEDLTADFGFIKPTIFGGPLGAIGNQVWLDLDNNGVFSPTAESGISGVVIELVQGGVVIATTTTNAEGRYLFSGLPAGSYSVRVNDTLNVLDGYSLATLGPNPGSDNNNQAQDYTINLGAGEINLTGDFAYVSPREATAVSLTGMGTAAWSAQLQAVLFAAVLITLAIVTVRTVILPKR